MRMKTILEQKWKSSPNLAGYSTDKPIHTSVHRAMEKSGLKHVMSVRDVPGVVHSYTARNQKHHEEAHKALHDHLTSHGWKHYPPGSTEENSDKSDDHHYHHPKHGTITVQQKHEPMKSFPRSAAHRAEGQVPTNVAHYENPHYFGHD